MQLVALPAHAQQQATPVATDNALRHARFNLGYGDYLVEIGQYLQALEAYQAVVDLADGPERAEAHLKKAQMLTGYLDDPEGAIREYRQVLAIENSRASDQEIARFQIGLQLLGQQRHAEAAAEFETYLQLYPDGDRAGSAAQLLALSRHYQADSAPPADSRQTLFALPVELPKVRVRLLKGSRRLAITSAARLRVMAGSGEVLQLPGGEALRLRADGGKVLVQGWSEVADRLEIQADEPLQLGNKEVRCSSGGAALPGRYRGSLHVLARAGRLLVVNEVDMDRYLHGVVPAEVFPNWPLEALKAQAIAARTYALYQRQHRQARDYDLVDDEGDQVYKGLRCQTPRTTLAVNVTRGQVLLHRQRPILAMYSANVGWHSAWSEHIFDQPLPYLTGVRDHFSPTQQMGRWQRRYHPGEIRARLARVGVQVDDIVDIRPHQVTPSGRVRQVELHYPGGRRQVLRTRPLLSRQLNLPDTLLTIRREGEAFVFDGSGFGHGVGLSQWGAKAMADQGMAATEILPFYYRGVQLRQVW